MPRARARFRVGSPFPVHSPGIPVMIGNSTDGLLVVRRACDELSRRLRTGCNCSAEEFFAADPAIEADPDAVMELLYTEFVVREQLGQQPRQETWLSRFPQWRNELEQVFDIHRLVTDTPAQRSEQPDTYKEAGTIKGDVAHRGRIFRYEAGAFVGGYELQEEIGRGAMGVVYRARQLSLGRLVALKMILSPHEERERARFRTEAEATARLSHPNIVQIFEVGQEDDLPFLSMELAPGRSLDKQLAESPLAPRTAAELLRSLALAIAHAHDKGIIHRDLKPANILIGGDGTPKITDFGLARQLLPDHPDAGATASGAIIGTPSYMAPEQCLSKRGQTGPAADIYSLGAILYEALTGRPPFRGETAFDTLELVREQDPVSPRRLVPKVPRDLETICLKCLAKDPQLRYVGANALAEDLQRFLNDSPILARPAGKAERILRWCRRNPAVAALTGGIALLLVCGTTISLSLAVWALQERTQAHSNASLEREARALADERLVQAENAVEQYLEAVEKNPRLKEADFFDLRKQLLTSAIPFLEDFVKQKPADASLEGKRGQACYRLGAVRKQLGELNQALIDFRQAQVIFEQLIDQFPSSSEFQLALSSTYEDSGLTLIELSRYDEAKVEIQKVIEAQTRLAAQFPSVVEYPIRIARSRSQLGFLLTKKKEFSEAEWQLRESLSLQAGVMAQNESTPGQLALVASTHRCLADALRSLGNQSESLQHFEQAIQLLEPLAARFAIQPDYRQQLAFSYNDLGGLLGDARKHEEAAKNYRHAITIKESLVAQFPTVPIYRKELANSRYNLGLALSRDRQPEADLEFQRCVSIYKQLTTDFPATPDFHRNMAVAQHDLALWYERERQPDKAMDEYRQALQPRRHLVEMCPDVPLYRSGLGRTLNSIGRLLRMQGDLAEAQRTYKEAIEQQLPLAEKARHDPDFAGYLRTSYRGLADATLSQKDHVHTANTAGHMSQVQPHLADDAVWAARYLGRCVGLVKQDARLNEAERQALAVSYANQATDHLRVAVRRGFKDGTSLRKFDALSPLRDRPDFKQLLQELDGQ